MHHQGLISRVGCLGRGTRLDFTLFLISAHVMSEWRGGGTHSSHPFSLAFCYSSSASESARGSVDSRWILWTLRWFPLH